MMKSWLSAAALALAATGANASTLYGIDEQNRLLTFDSAAPGAIQSSVQVTGLHDSILSMDVRPINGTLYGLGGDLVIYTIDATTGAATAVSGPLALAGTQFAFDFNPTIDRLRIVSNTNQNYVFNPNDSSLSTVTSVFFGAGDANEGVDPDITALAYTSSVFGADATTTQLYGIDTAQNVLVRQANSAGTLTTVGALGIDFGSRDSFDILGSEAIAVDGRSFYSVDLQSGALTLLGTADRSIYGLAFAAAVPEPSSWAMMIAGFGLVGAAFRRRSARVAFAV
jgi:hypothetical protein